MLKFKLPLFSGFEDVNTVQSLNAKVGASQKTIDQKNISLVAELDSVLAEVSALKARLDLEEKNLERSERYYKMTLEEYRRGIKNSPDMVGASERLLDARIRNLEYRRDLMLAKAKIQELTGE
jgi:outer membrane protein TolC